MKETKNFRIILFTLIIVIILFFAMVGLEVILLCEREVTYINNVTTDLILKGYNCN